jgi:chloride channel protein, CIC family
MVFDLKRLRPNEGRLFVIISIVIGVLAGTAVVGYHFLIAAIFDKIYWRGIEQSLLWKRLVFPTLGALFGGALLLRWNDARGSGVNQVRISLLAHDAQMSVRGTVGKFLASGVAIGCGLPLGPEDPAIHIGGGVASALGRLMALSKKRLQELIPVGAAAGLAAAFNTPITAVIFTLEEIVGDINAPMLGSTVLAAVIAVMIRRAAVGSQPLFAVPQYSFSHASELLLFALLGLLGGVASAGFTQLVAWLRGRLGRIPRRGPIDVITVAGGFVAGALALLAPRILGVGYSTVSDALNGHLVLKVLILLFALKALATAVAFSSGNSGGLFAPSLFIGAMLGGAVGTLGARYFPSQILSPGTYALVGMGVTFAGIIRAPITSFFMIFEVTQDYQIMLPVMIANMISYAVAEVLHKEPLFDVLARQDGIRLPRKEDRQLQTLTNTDAMRQPTIELDAREPISSALARIPPNTPEAFVVTDDGLLAGVVTRTSLRQAASEESGSAPVGAIAVLREQYLAYPDESLALSLEKLRQGAVLLPVVSRLQPDHLLGVVEASDVLRAYRIAVEPTEKKVVNPEARETNLERN